MKTKKKKVFTQILPVFLPTFSVQIPKVGAMTQFRALVLHIYALLASQRGGPWHNAPLNTPLYYTLLKKTKNPKLFSLYTTVTNRKDREVKGNFHQMWAYFWLINLLGATNFWKKKQTTKAKKIFHLNFMEICNKFLAKTFRFFA